MNTKLERIERNQVALEIEVPIDKMEAAMSNAYKKLAPKFNIPGFRKGKVPRPVLESFIGKEALMEEALEEIISQSYEAAVNETAIEPVAQPTVEIISMEEGQPLVFKASVVVKPEVKLGKTTGFTVEVPKIEISEEDIEGRLAVMQNRYAKLVTVEADVPAEKGDLLSIDFVGYLDEVPFPGGSGEDYSLELGSGTFIPGFEDQLIGAVTGEERQVNVDFPEEYQAEELAGQAARFECKVKEIKRKELSPIDDDFARDVSEFENLEELKADIRKTLQDFSEKRSKQIIRDAVVAQVAEEADMEIPDEMVQNQIDIMVQQFEERLFYQGMKMENYLQMTGAVMEDIREQFHPQAAQTVKDNLVLEAVAKELEMKVTDEDFEQQIEKAAEEFNMTGEDVRKSLQNSRQRIEYGILLDKAVDYLIENATLVEKEDSDDTNQD
ncbi:MAG: trigger factor [Ignavibacteriales bacterium]